MNDAETLMTVRKELSVDFNIPEAGDAQKIITELRDAINHLIQTDLARLVSILYRIDISEDTINASLKSCPGADAGLIIARLLIDRQLQKINMRRQFKPQQDIPDDEKW